MTIGELARAASLSPSAIRYYEAAGIFAPPTRKNGVRQYDADAVADLKVLRFYRESGISIQGLVSIAKHLRGSTARRNAWTSVLKTRIHDLEREIESAKRSKAALEAAVACRCTGEAARCAVIKAAGVSPDSIGH